MACETCGDTGVIETGNNDLPCSCPAGDKALFNVAGAAKPVTGQEVRASFRPCRWCGGTGVRTGVAIESGKSVTDFCPCKAKPCPYCGSAVSEKTRYQTSIVPHAPIDLSDWKKGIHPENIEYCLECGECHASGPLALSQEAAVDAWNQRAEVEALKIGRRGFQIMARNMVANGSGWAAAMANGDYERAGGDVECPVCRQAYYEHPEIPSLPTFHLTGGPSRSEAASRGPCAAEPGRPGAGSRSTSRRPGRPTGKRS